MQCGRAIANERRHFTAPFPNADSDRVSRVMACFSKIGKHGLMDTLRAPQWKERQRGKGIHGATRQLNERPALNVLIVVERVQRASSLPRNHTLLVSANSLPVPTISERLFRALTLSPRRTLKFRARLVREKVWRWMRFQVSERRPVRDLTRLIASERVADQ